MMQKLCACWPKNDQKCETPKIQQDEDATYGTIDDDEPKPGVSFRTKAKSETSKRQSAPPNGNHSIHPPESPRRSFGFNFRKNKQQQSVPHRELPKLPKKTFSRNLPAIDDVINPTYESIDAENDSISDPLYSKVDENPATQRYDYPSFRTKVTASTSGTSAKRKITPGNEEPLYTSASQIYSGGSEDPYSSIVSESGGPSTSRKNTGARTDDNNSSIYDPAYARVKDPKPALKDPSPGPSNVREIPLNIDQLYAKINRPSVRRQRSHRDDVSDGGPGTSASRPTVSFAQDVNQTNESGSGSIASGSSANPSYRYLTVRETVDVVRERIRQRQANQAENENGPIREHYYSTIANEYESVGGGSLSDSIYGVAIPVVNASTRAISPLTLNVARLSGIYEATPPRPPTSPIPNRQPPSASASLNRPIVVSQASTSRMSTSLIAHPRILTSPSGDDDRANSNPNLASQRSTTRMTDTFQPGSSFLNSWHSQTAAAALNNRVLFPRGNPRIIPPVSSSTNAFTSPLRIQESFNSQRSVDTPTRDLVDSETQTNSSSRIPVSTARLNRQRSQSPAVDSSTQTNGISTEQELRRSRLNLASVRPSTSLNPLPSGRDYVSPVDLSTKRAWPLNNNEAAFDRNIPSKENK